MTEEVIFEIWYGKVFGETEIPKNNSGIFYGLLHTGYYFLMDLDNSNRDRDVLEIEARIANVVMAVDFFY